MRINITVEEAVMLDCIEHMRGIYKNEDITKEDKPEIMTDLFFGCMKLLDQAGVK